MMGRGDLQSRIRARKARIRSSAGAIEREGLAITLEVATGTIAGRAEIAPLAGFALESLDEIERALDAIDWAEVDPSQDDPLTIAERLLPLELPSARFAIEVALLDLAARAHGLSVAQMLCRGRPSTAIRNAAVIDTLEGARDAAVAASNAGAGALRLEIGREGRAEAERAMLLDLRAWLGDGVKIRAHAHGRLGDPSHPLIGALAEIGCELLEEPFPVEVLLAAGELPLPIALDESAARNPILSLRAVDRRYAEALVIKPALIGGLARSLAFADAIQRRGGRVLIGHAFDAPHSFVACGHLALALNDGEVHELARYPELDAWTDERGALIPVSRAVDTYQIELHEVAGLG